MLREELTCHKVRLLLRVLMLEDAGRNHYAIPSVDPIVSDEPRYFGDEGYKALIDQLARLLGSVTPSYRRTATYIALAYLLHVEGGVSKAPPKVLQRCPR